MIEIAWALYTFGVLAVATSVGTLTHNVAYAMLVFGLGALFASSVLAFRLVLRWACGD